MTASFPRLSLTVCSAVLTAACAAAGPPRVSSSPSASAPAPGPPAEAQSLAALAAAPLDLSWEASRLSPATDYLHFPAADGGPGFFLVRDGFRFLDVDDFALHYDRAPVGFDSHSPFPITLRDPAISGILKRLVDSWLPSPEIEIRFEESGAIREADAKWAEYVRGRFAFMAGKVREAEKPPGFRLLSPPRW